VIQPGDIVRHKKDKALVRGIVRKISNSGLRAKVFLARGRQPYSVL